MSKPFRISILTNDLARTDLELSHLREQGYIVETYQAVGNLQLAQPLPDLFIIDTTSLDQFNLVTQIRHLSPHVGVLVTIPLTNQEGRVQAFLAGADNYLVRPYEVEELLAIVGSLKRRLGWVN
ncbi:response regulator transcription factor [Limnohabitans sp. 103DPR2]|uniref:response regulator transcription factor n=1 Tax=Limnohabitans sp. 103DPR2 TaxID=1678129 RepID=UPI0012E10FE0|nr:response regulator transcription factor [Limnohabitans sp. 103DPR2]